MYGPIPSDRATVETANVVVVVDFVLVVQERRPFF
jgi:hypothetical protein